MSEQSIVVNEQDEIIEFRERTKLTHADRIRITVVWIEDGKGNALIHRRSPLKSSWPNYWENAAGGGVAHNETYEENAYKELAEEIGVHGVPLTFVKKICMPTPHGERYCSWYTAVLDRPIEQFVLQESEVAELKWVPKAELFAHRDAHPDLYMPSSAYWRELFDTTS